MATIAQDILSQELYNDTEQSGEGPGQVGGITRSVVAVQKSILRQIPLQVSQRQKCPCFWSFASHQGRGICKEV